MRFHIFQHVPFENEGTIGLWAKKEGASISKSLFYENTNLPLMESFEILIVLGGPMNIYEEKKFFFLKEEKKFIEKAIFAGKKVLGICLGAQLIADVMGAKITRNKSKEIGWFKAERTNIHPFLEKFPENFTVFQWHGDTFSIPEGAVRIAKSELCENQAFAYKDTVIGLQFHLESTPESIQALIDNCSDELVERPGIQTSKMMLSKKENFTLANQMMEQLMQNFLIQSSVLPSPNPSRVEEIV
jgi:GMP synthase (glutamine-hydrolysing)